MLLVWGAIRGEAHPTIDIPPDDKDGLLGLFGGGDKGGEIVRTVDEERDTSCSGYVPAISPFGE
jgi:hypothetical protein